MWLRGRKRLKPEIARLLPSSTATASNQPTKLGSEVRRSSTSAVVVAVVGVVVVVVVGGYARLEWDDIKRSKTAHERDVRAVEVCKRLTQARTCGQVIRSPGHHLKNKGDNGAKNAVSFGFR